MRISDWSSDVCSSDLRRSTRYSLRFRIARRRSRSVRASTRATTWGRSFLTSNSTACWVSSNRASRKVLASLRVRSEEHTSELQSLMRISYAVFCLKKKKHNEFYTPPPTHHTPPPPPPPHPPHP